MSEKMCDYYHNGVCMDDEAPCAFAEGEMWEGCPFYECTSAGEEFSLSIEDNLCAILGRGTSPEVPTDAPGGASLRANGPTQRAGEPLEVVYLDVEQIDHHPDNPRKDVGDVTELAESIRSEGIQQPLTVVPHVAGEPGRYTAVIGHRRLEAAKIAGLAKVPAFVREMTRREQLRTMMTENTQRRDLTPLEEADGFQQLMLELPEQTVAAVARETGFSETTVRRRMKLLELPREAVEEAESRNVTLGDYEKLHKIKDPERKAEVLKTAGTEEFDQAVKNALEREEKLRHKERLIRELKALGCEEVPLEGRDTRSDLENVTWVYDYRWKETEHAKEWVKDWTDCMYTVGDTWIRVVRVKKDIPKPDAAERERRRLRAVEEMDELHAEMEQMVQEFRLNREDFVGTFGKWERNREEIVAFAVRMMLANSYTVDMDNLADWLGIEKDKDGLEEAGLRRMLRQCPEKVLLYTAYWSIESNYRSYTQLDGRDYELNTKKVYHQAESRTDKLYEGLKELGYLMSEDELKWQRGTLPQYARAKEISAGWKK